MAARPTRTIYYFDIGERYFTTMQEAIDEQRALHEAGCGWHKILSYETDMDPAMDDVPF